MIEKPFEKVYMVKNYSNAYVVEFEDHLIIIDTGMDKKAKELIEAIEKTGKEPRTVLLTHAHLDHIAGLAKLKEKYPNIKVVVSEEERAAVEGKEYLLPKGVKGFFFRLGMPFIYKSVKVDETLKEEYEQFKVIKASGHTKGSVCFLLDKLLFCGDLIVNTEKGLDIPPQEFNFDRNQLIESIKKISELDFESLLSGHGEVVKEAKEKVKSFLSSLQA